MTYRRGNTDDGLFKLGAYGALFAAFALAASMGACSDEGLNSKAADAVRDQGMTPIEVGGYGWFKCGENDTFATKFKAKNVNDREVTGVVCKGLTKGYTIRYN